MRSALLSVLASVAPLVLADVEITSPKAGSSIAMSSPIVVDFKESGSGPKITTFTGFQALLVAGGDDDDVQTVCSGTTSGTFSASSVSITPTQLTTCGSAKNAYFIKFVSTTSTGEQYINYSGRFSVTGFTGTFAAGVAAALTALDGATAAPPVETAAETTAAAAGEAGMFTVAYNLQTGDIKYAPMQPVPPTKITAKSATPLNPTSAFNIATTYLSPASITYTVTESQTFSVSSIENTIAVASQPTDDMARFLARWKD